MPRKASKPNGTKQSVKALDVFYTLLFVLAITIAVSLSQRDSSNKRPSAPSSRRDADSARHETVKDTATQEPQLTRTKHFDPDMAANGRRIFEQTIRKHTNLDEFYSRIDARFSYLGTPIGLHLPKSEWESFSLADKESIYHFLQSNDQGNGWRLTIGQLDGADIRSDELAMSSEIWVEKQSNDPVPQDREDTDSDPPSDTPDWREAITSGETGFSSGIEKNLLYAEARSFVRDSLVDRSGAKFASPVSDASVSVYRDDDGRVTVKGWVESSNRLGAKGRTYWAVRMMPTSDHRWILLSLSEQD